MPRVSETGSFLFSGCHAGLFGDLAHGCRHQLVRRRAVVDVCCGGNLRMGSAGRAQSPGSAERGAPLVRIGAAGDVGTGSDTEWATASLMDRAEDSVEFDALLLLGDNVYPHGDPERLADTVFDPFGGVLDGDTVLLGVLGNHDVEQGNALGQVQGLGMPWRWYAETFGDVLIVILDSTQPESRQQISFLEDTLAASNAKWTIVALHHPPYSAGSHGSDLPTREAFESIFVAYGVDLVLSGHEHDYQRSRPIDGTTYVVSGGAAKLRPTGSASFTEFSASAFHFVTLDVWDDRIVVSAFSRDGLLDRAVLAAD